MLQVDARHTVEDVIIVRGFVPSIGDKVGLQKIWFVLRWMKSGTACLDLADGLILVFPVSLVRL